MRPIGDEAWVKSESRIDQRAVWYPPPVEAEKMSRNMRPDGRSMGEYVSRINQRAVWMVCRTIFTFYLVWDPHNRYPI